MTFFLRFILICTLPAFAIAAVAVGLVLGARNAITVWLKMWREYDV